MNCKAIKSKLIKASGFSKIEELFEAQKNFNSENCAKNDIDNVDNQIKVKIK